MITDEQYKALQNRVSELESKLNAMAVQLNGLTLKGDARAVSATDSKVDRTGTRDGTKYKFGNRIYCKRRLVLEVVKRYINDHGDLSYEELTSVFPDYLQGALGVMKPIRDAERYSNAVKRYYFSDGDIVVLNGARYVVCSQWDVKNIDRFLRVARNYYEIEKINY